MDEELAQAANTPLPEDEDAGNAAADQQTDSAGGVAAGQVRTPPQPLFMLWRKVRAPVYRYVMSELADVSCSHPALLATADWEAIRWTG